MINVAEDIITVDELRPKLGDVVREVGEGQREVVVTLRGKAQVVMMSATTYTEQLRELERYRNQELVETADRAAVAPTLDAAEGVARIRAYANSRVAERKPKGKAATILREAV